MKFTSLLLTLGFAAQIFAADAPNAAGLQLYSLRSQFKLRGVPWTLDRVKEFGIKEIAVADYMEQRDGQVAEFDSAAQVCTGMMAQ